MEKITAIIKEELGDKYNFFRLKDVLVTDEDTHICLLYPEDISLTDAEKLQIKQAIIKNIPIKNLSVALNKSFLNTNLIAKNVFDYIATNHKIVATSLQEGDISVQKDDKNIQILINLEPGAYKYFEQNRLQTAICNFIESKYICTCKTELKKDETKKIDVDLDNIEVEFELKRQVTRFEVEPIKKVFGNDISPRPEYIKNIKGKKLSCILAGIIEGIKQRTFKIKQGKKAGEEKAYFIFNLNDGKKIDCVVFATKQNQKNLEALEDGVFVCCLGDVEYNKYGTLSYRIKAMMLARPKKLDKWAKESSNIIDLKKIKSVVSIEKMESLVQDNMFGIKTTYDDNIMGKTIVVYDLETTGLDTEKCEILEIGAVKMINGIVCERFETLVKPTTKIPKEASDVNHITDSMVSNAPNISNVIADFYKFTRGATLAGHNIISYDNKVLFRVAENFGITFDNEVLDTIELAHKKVFLPKYNLGTLAKFYKIPHEEAHRAWSDSYTNALVLLKMCEVPTK